MPLDVFLGRDTDSKVERQYRKMYFIRHFEQTLLQLFEEGMLNGTTHCCIGQEADSVGIMEHLQPNDHVFSNHRCHGHYLARTGDAFGLIAEIMGKRSGICAGYGGSQHIGTDRFKSNGIQGGIVPAATGIALSMKMKKQNTLSVVFIGDGTLGEGILYESLNMASLWKLPLLCVVENNGWAQSTPIQRDLAGTIRERFSAFDIPVEELTTTDVQRIDSSAEELICRIRRGEGPQVLVINTYRLCHHSKNDDNRPEKEVNERWETEPLRTHAIRLNPEVMETIEKEVKQALLSVVAKVKDAI